MSDKNKNTKDEETDPNEVLKDCKLKPKDGGFMFDGGISLNEKDGVLTFPSGTKRYPDGTFYNPDGTKRQPSEEEE